MKPKLRLFHYWRSSCSWRVRMGMEFKGMKPELVAIDLLKHEGHSPEHRKRNPTGFVPALEILDGPLKGHTLGESFAILEWLEEVCPEPSFFPRSDDANVRSFLRARSRQLAEIINAGTQPLQNLQVMKSVSQDPEIQKQWNQKWIEKGLNAFESALDPKPAAFCFGNEISLADFFLLPQCFNAIRFEVPMDRFKRISQIWNSAQTHPCFLRSHPNQYQPNDKS